MMRLLAIDPGPAQSAFVLFHGDVIESAGIELNEALLLMLSGRFSTADHLAIEMIASYGMPVGKDVFETCVWIGRFVQKFSYPFTKVYRKDVKMHLCGSTRAKDGNIRQALIDRYGPDAIGKKANPGPLYGIKADLWAALAVGVTYLDLEGKNG